jgi:hypothetical protein
MDEGQGNGMGAAWARHAIAFNGPKMHCGQHWGVTIFENNTTHTYTVTIRTYIEQVLLQAM